jgi:hypothetical protein
MKKLAVFIILIGSNLVGMQYACAKSAIYKCLDEYGRPIFSQQATCTKPETVNYTSKQLADKQKEKQDKQQKDADDKQKEQCSQAKATHSSYKRAPFLTKSIQSDGKVIRIRLSKEEVQQAIEDAQQEVDYWCNK